MRTATPRKEKSIELDGERIRLGPVDDSEIDDFPNILSWLFQCANMPEFGSNMSDFALSGDRAAFQVTGEL